jgi:hypothetical protein
MRQYIKQRFFDWLLCLVMASCITQVVCSGFVLEEGAYRGAAAIFALSAVMQALLQLISYRRRFVIFGIIAGALLAVAAVIVIKTTQPFSDESANSRFIFFLMLFSSSLLVFLLSRTRAGAVVLFLFGTIACAWAHFLQYPITLWSLLLFEFSVFAMFFFRVYIVSMLRADVGKVRIKAYMLQTGVVCLAAFVLSGGIYFGVVQPLNPPTQELKLITRLQSMPLLQVMGVASTKVIFDSELASLNPPDTTEFSSDTGDTENESVGDKPLQTGLQNFGQNLPEYFSDVQQVFETVNYKFFRTRYVLLLLFIPLVIVGAYVSRLLFRKHWHRKMQSLPREDAAANYYSFFLKRFKRLGIKRLGCHTLREYVGNNLFRMQTFSVGNTSFASLTDTYEKVLYGGGNISPEEYEQFERYYSCFYKNLRQELGGMKYCLRIFQF